MTEPSFDASELDNLTDADVDALAAAVEATPDTYAEDPVPEMPPHIDAPQETS